MNPSINAYRAHSLMGIEEHSPHQLVAMLYRGAMDRLAQASGHLERGEIAAKAECLSKAVAIIDTLRVSLRRDVGDGSLAERLEALYAYMLQQLTAANLHSDPLLITEVRDLLQALASGWDAIPMAERQPVAARPGAAR